MKNTALILVDLQNDFMPAGQLAVPQGDEVVAVANQWMLHFDLVVATQDWHPHDHLSFASQYSQHRIGDQILLNEQEQILWPDHCLQNSFGAEFAAQLNKNGIHHVIQKGMRRHVDSYSGFFDNCRQHSTGLHELLQSYDIQQLYIMGLATDYCVKYTALDARALGYQISLLQEGCRAVNLAKGDDERAIAELVAAGVLIK